MQTAKMQAANAPKQLAEVPSAPPPLAMTSAKHPTTTWVAHAEQGWGMRRQSAHQRAPMHRRAYPPLISRGPPLYQGHTDDRFERMNSAVCWMAQLYVCSLRWRKLLILSST